MALSTYKKKRSFNKTPEPQGGKPDAPTLRFVVQKHDATRLHYDFRLEMEGVLKSWAVPKGPSLNPEDKRLAMMVEDHPYDYRDFEGIIPKGNYGAGTVIVWDEGTYEPLETSGDKKKDEKALLKQLKSGSLKFSLHGEKLKGEFALVKLKNAEDNAWLLIKHRDKFAKAIDVTRKVRSVKSDKTLEEVEKTSDNVWGKQGTAGGKAAAPKKAAAKKAAAPKKAAAKKAAVSGKSTAKKAAAAKKEVAKKAAVSGKSAAKKAAAAKKEVAKKTAVSGKSAAKKTAKGSPKQVAASPALPKSRAVKKKAAEADLKKAPKAPFPKTLSPMLATLVDKPFDEPGWLYEIKWDGYRAVALCNKGKVELISRNNKSFNDKFYPVFDAVSEWGVNAVVDGEICVINDEGVSNFGRLQNWRSEADGQLMYYVFDLLWLDGKDLTGLPLTERRALLAPLMPKKVSSA
ncbi:DNA polymerase ligase N-terminal domain-containing protein [Chitinophaga sedimenti]|uniref:DNA polymerase ligase N-terminal domain-containing protein n=1 Tax=Chitinophaga sedimenti TaxID=2033606 RepID=UPI00249E91EC|nr:DNA polymerase ligase N-terminal domain-containing protein [Chitinophaga sedimenti]